MIPSDIIAKKRDGEELKSIELSLFINEKIFNRGPGKYVSFSILKFKVRS